MNGISANRFKTKSKSPNTSSCYPLKRKLVSYETRYQSRRASEDGEVFPYNENWEDSHKNESSETTIGDVFMDQEKEDIKNILSDVHSKCDSQNMNMFLMKSDTKEYAFDDKNDTTEQKEGKNEMKERKSDCDGFSPGKEVEWLKSISYRITNCENKGLEKCDEKEEVSKSKTRCVAMNGEVEGQNCGFISQVKKNTEYVTDSCSASCSNAYDYDGNRTSRIEMKSCEAESCDVRVCDIMGSNVNMGTDFSRFKESNSFTAELITSQIWQTLENDDLESFSHHVGTKLEKCFENSRKRSLPSDSKNKNAEVGDNITDGSIVPSKKQCLDDDVDKPSTSKADSRPRRSSQKVERSKTYPTIPNSCYVALDCEMVGVGFKGSRSALGRCSIVDYEGNVLYDQYVVPSEPVTDYRTRWSGIRPKHMTCAEPLWKACHEIRLLLKNKIIIGHAVRNDFAVIHFHPPPYLVRDTAKCRLFAKMANLDSVDKGHSLKALTKRILGQDIQVGKQGHDSVEDAKATLELFKVVREEWEMELFDSWRGEGLNVEAFVTSLTDGKDFVDVAGKRILDFSFEKTRSVKIDRVCHSLQNGNGDQSRSVNMSGKLCQSCLKGRGLGLSVKSKSAVEGPCRSNGGCDNGYMDCNGNVCCGSGGRVGVKEDGGCGNGGESALSCCSCGDDRDRVPFGHFDSNGSSNSNRNGSGNEGKNGDVVMGGWGSGQCRKWTDVDYLSDEFWLDI